MTKLYDFSDWYFLIYYLRSIFTIAATSVFGFYIFTTNFYHDETMVDTIKDFTAYLILLEIDNLQRVEGFTL